MRRRPWTGLKKRASLKSFKLIIPAVIFLLAALALAGQVAFASIGNQSANELILADVYFTNPVPDINPGRPNESCIIGIFNGPEDDRGGHNWWLLHRSDPTLHTVNLNVWATSVNPAEVGEITVRITDAVSTKEMTVPHPAGGENMGTLAVSVIGGNRYEFSVSRTGEVAEAHHYRLGTDTIETELGWGGRFDYLYYMEAGRNDWAFHASPQPQEANAVDISIVVDATGTGEVPNQAQNITYAVVDAATLNDVIPQTTQAINPGSPINIAFPVAAGNATFILKIDGDGHYRMQNQSGTDWGFYLLPCPEQEGHDGGPRLVLVDPEDPHTDIARLPIVLESAGDEAVIDFRIEPGEGLDNIYAGEFHFVVEGPLEVLDARPDLPGMNLATQEDGLAPNFLEELNLSTVGFPDNGGVLRTCDWDAQPPGMFTAWMDSQQATTSPNDLPALGIAQMDLNDDQTELGYGMRVETDLLTSPITVAHFHEGLPGETGGVVRDLNFVGDTAEGVWSASDSSQPLTPARVDQLFAGELYINIHTQNNPGGEIRGQVIWNDSLYDFIKGELGDTPDVPLQLLNQHERDDWGDNWCGPTAAGISLGWFAELGDDDGGGEGGMVVVPNANGDVEGDQQFFAPLENSARFQVIYPADELIQDGVIDKIAFRPDFPLSQAGTSTPDFLQVTLSHTDTAPGGLSTTFDDNLGPDATLVLDVDGVPFSTAKTNCGDGGPCDFDIVLDVENTFTYDGVRNLLVEFRGDITDGSSIIIDADSAFGHLFSSDSTAEQGGIFNVSPVIKFTFLAEPEPIFPGLIPDTDGDGVVDEEEKYDAIGMLGNWMMTDPDAGTTDNKMVSGIDNYINSRGLTGAFVIKTFNHPTFWDYAGELEDGEDVLVGISYPGGGGHWLVGRSFSEELNDNGTPGDPADDYYAVSFVDPGSGSVYHSKMRWWDDAIWYNDEWVEFDIMISVSPDERDHNIDTAQIFVPVNEVYWDGDAQFGDLTFTLLGDPRPGQPLHRTEPFVADEWGGISLARMHVRALDKGIATIFMISPDGVSIPVLMVPVDDQGDPVIDPPQVEFQDPAGIVEIDLVQIRVKLQGTRDEDFQSQVPLGVALFEPSQGGGFPDELPVAEFFCEQTRRDGPWAVCALADTPEGFFDVFVASVRTLDHVKRNVEMDGNVDFENPLREGDLNQSGTVNASDFAEWLETWRDELPLCPPDGFDGFSVGDFDKDCFVGATDFSIFLENWREESPQEEPQ